MKYDYPAVNINFRARHEPGNPIDPRTAYHQAGRAVAIFLGNRQKQLPDVHFQIVIKPQDGPGRSSRNPCTFKATLEGGRLIQNLTQSFTEVTQTLSLPDQEQCRRAIESDIANLLAGPLAEAKYVALRDARSFNANLVYLGTLPFYGGKAMVNALDEYMECLLAGQADLEFKRQTLANLFLAAYSFINQPANWAAIAALASLILEVDTVNSKDVIDCEDVAALLADCSEASISLTG